MRESGLPRCDASISLFGTLSGTLRSPSMSSENAISRVLILSSVSTRKAWRTMVVRATSPNVPMMRQARGAVAGLEDHLVLGLALEPRHELARLLERPGVRLLGDFAQALGGWHFDGRHQLSPARGH